MDQNYLVVSYDNYIHWYLFVYHYSYIAIIQWMAASDGISSKYLVKWKKKHGARKEGGIKSTKNRWLRISLFLL